MTRSFDYLGRLSDPVTLNDYSEKIMSGTLAGTNTARAWNGDTIDRPTIDDRAILRVRASAENLESLSHGFAAVRIADLTVSRRLRQSRSLVSREENQVNVAVKMVGERTKRDAISKYNNGRPTYSRRFRVPGAMHGRRAESPVKRFSEMGGA